MALICREVPELRLEEPTSKLPQPSATRQAPLALSRPHSSRQLDVIDDLREQTVRQIRGLRLSDLRNASARALGLIEPTG